MTNSDRELSLGERVAIYSERLAIGDNNVASTEDLCLVFKNDEAVHAWLDTFDIPRTRSVPAFESNIDAYILLDLKPL